METLPISVWQGSSDYKLFRDIVNQGIDARLTGFTKSEFEHKESRLYLDFAVDEIEILLRRLTKVAETDENAEMWLQDIVMCLYDVEIY